MRSPPRSHAPRGRWTRALLFVALVSLPVVAHQLYRWLTALPERITFATGPEGGRYRDVMQLLAYEVTERLGVRVELIHTQGSVENLELLSKGDVDFALYQQGTWEILAGSPIDDVASVARVYSEPTHLIVREASGIESVADLGGRVVDLGSKGSGDYALSTILLDHLGLSAADVDARYLDYEQATDQMRSGELDAAFVTAGFEAPMYAELFRSGEYRLIELPYVEALTLRYFFLTPFRIPAGKYRSLPEPIPPVDIDTVSTTAQLLARTDVASGMVEEIAAILHDRHFAKLARLRELFTQGEGFSRRQLDFPLHPGASLYFDPHLRPLIDPEFAEATENLRSLVFSSLIALFLVYRWVRRSRERHQEHKLDRFIRELLAIERDQVGFDQRRVDEQSAEKQTAELQVLLDQVTHLRQEALGEFDAHELNEDRGPDCFVQMCHALSDKINAKLTRLRLDEAMRELGRRINPEVTER